MVIRYKKKCIRCKKNYVPATNRTRYVVCYECQKNDLKGEIKDPKMKKLLNISEELYQQSSFLRNIKVNYLRYGSLTEKQIQVFKDVVKKLKEK
ncbi:hypothetical protein COV16_02880 [Candidatus Woesearchaeota archaeon CG10_big_fil_rev_8_21_14_0_10_34_8]|nr:MAG: hypothetical protein COV16_02880 [Candidatus Woesearchaeota archaeon CG10_big_fil_rev_8_21_14_0_10_34_8]